jgi:hypothetical protein
MPKPPESRRHLQPHSGGIALRAQRKGDKGASYYMLTVPPLIGDVIPAGAVFDCELTEEKESCSASASARPRTTCPIG